MSKKRSFLERLTGSVAHDDFDSFDDDMPRAEETTSTMGADLPDEPMEGQLPVDVYQTASDIVIRAFVAGVRPDELSVSISRDMVVIGGSREEREEAHTADYFTRELFWGSFSRTILLPNEVDVESSSAHAKDGLLTLILPKYDKGRQTKIKVRAN